MESSVTSYGFSFLSIDLLVMSYASFSFPPVPGDLLGPPGIEMSRVPPASLGALLGVLLAGPSDPYIPVTSGERGTTPVVPPDFSLSSTGVSAVFPTGSPA